MVDTSLVERRKWKDACAELEAATGRLHAAIQSGNHDWIQRERLAKLAFQRKIDEMNMRLECIGMREASQAARKNDETQRTQH